ncbi:MAG: hypothetical protein AAF996_18375 [Pseudomonadota bacterium]
MSAQPQVVIAPSDLEEIDIEIDDELEGGDAEALSDAPKGIVDHLKSPIGMIAIGVIVVLLGGVGFLFGFGVIGGDGKPQLDANAEVSTALGEGAEAIDPVAPVTETEQVATSDEALNPTERAPGGVDQSETLEEVKAPTYGEITYTDTGAIYHTSPTNVPLLIDGESRDLTLSLGILADRASAELLKDEGLTVNLLTIEAAQSVDFGPFLDWEIPGLITKDLRARLQAEFPDAKIRAIMIRDFQL